MKRISWFFILFIFLVGISQDALAQPAELTLLKKINVASSADNTRIELRFSIKPLQEKITYHENFMQLEFPESYINPPKQWIDVEDEVVKNIFAYQFDDSTVRVRLFTYNKVEGLKEKIRVSKNNNKVVILYEQVPIPVDKEGQTTPSPIIKSPLINPPPLNPHPALPHKGGGEKEGIIRALPPGEGRLEKSPSIPPPQKVQMMGGGKESPSIPPPLTGGGKGAGDKWVFSGEAPMPLQGTKEHENPLPVDRVRWGRDRARPELVSGVRMGLFSNESSDISASIFKMIMALGIVLSLLFVAIFLFKKFLGKKIGLGVHDQNIRIITSTYLGPKKSIALVDVAGERIVVGVTPTHITMLTRLGKDNEFKDILKEQISFPNDKVELNDELWEKV